MEFLSYLAMGLGFFGMGITLLGLLYGIFGLLVRSCVDDKASTMDVLNKMYQHELRHHTPKKRKNKKG